MSDPTAALRELEDGLWEAVDTADGRSYRLGLWSVDVYLHHAGLACCAIFHDLQRYGAAQVELDPDDPTDATWRARNAAFADALKQAAQMLRTVKQASRPLVPKPAPRPAPGGTYTETHGFRVTFLEDLTETDVEALSGVARRLERLNAERLFQQEFGSILPDDKQEPRPYERLPFAVEVREDKPLAVEVMGLGLEVGHE